MEYRFIDEIQAPHKCLISLQEIGNSKKTTIYTLLNLQMTKKILSHLKLFFGDSIHERELFWNWKPFTEARMKPTPERGTRGRVETRRDYGGRGQAKAIEQWFGTPALSDGQQGGNFGLILRPRQDGHRPKPHHKGIYRQA